MKYLATNANWKQRETRNLDRKEISAEGAKYLATNSIWIDF